MNFTGWPTGKKILRLLFASKNELHNNAVVLKDLLDGMRKPPTGTGPGAAACAAGRPSVCNGSWFSRVGRAPSPARLLAAVL